MFTTPAFWDLTLAASKMGLYIIIYKQGKRKKQNFFVIFSYLLNTYRPFHKTLPRSSSFVNWISVRFNETGCIKTLLDLHSVQIISLLDISLTTKSTNCTPPPSFMAHRCFVDIEPRKCTLSTLSDSSKL